MNRDQYFASLPFYDQEIGNELQAKVDDYYSWLTSSALVQLWRRSYYAYYGLQTNGSGSGFGTFAIGSIQPSGSEGEIAKLKVNHYANLVNHRHVLATESRPALNCEAINDDVASLDAADTGEGIIEYFFRERKLETNYRLAVLLAIQFGEAFVRLDWDAQAGRSYGEGPNGTPLYDGDITAKTYNPFDVVRDIHLSDPAERKWYTFRDSVNKYDLCAKYPHLADEILNSTGERSTVSNRRFQDPTQVIAQMGGSTTGPESVLIDQFEFLHEATPSCPQGRYTVFLQGGVVLFDGPLPFSHVPGYRISAGEVVGSPFGWTPAYDCLGIQEAIDKLYTIVLTNQLAAGIQNFWQPPNNGLTKSEMGGGLNLLESLVEPKALAMVQTPAEIFNFIRQLEQVLETLSGVSAVSRGQTPENLKSGAALAFANATSVAFSSGLSESANRLLEDMGNGLVEILRDFAATPRIATVAGSSKASRMKSYAGKDLIPINRVTCEVTAAASQTRAGKIQIAQDMLQSQLIKTPQDYIAVYNTGKLDPLFEDEMSEILLVRSENESLRAGRPARALRIDDHAYHIARHKSVLSNPKCRDNPNDPMVLNTLAHIQEHEQLALMMQQTDPAFLAATKQQPLPFPQPQPVAPPQGLPQAQQAPDNSNSGVQPAKMPNLPQGATPNLVQANAKFQNKG